MSLTLPTGTSVCYIDADSEDPASIRVPAWSLRAMALKKKRVQVSRPTKHGLTSVMVAGNTVPAASDAIPISWCDHMSLQSIAAFVCNPFVGRGLP